MPVGKTRGILREYLQVLILKELYQLESGKKLYFTGGSYLRLAHHLKRFSEDLDFNTSDIFQKEFEELIQKISLALSRTGILSKVQFDRRKAQWEDVCDIF